MSHFHVGSGAAEDEEESPQRGVVVSAADCAAQFAGLQTLWAQVNRELAQELAEGSIEQRSDPLAFLSVGGGGGGGGAPTGKSKQRAGAAAQPAIRKVPKKKQPAAQDAAAPAPPSAADTTKRRKTRPMMMFTTKAGAAAGGAGGATPEDAAASAARTAAASAADDAWLNPKSGHVCARCGSDRTVADDKGGGNVQMPKAETWGSKDAPEQVLMITCRDCKNAWHEGAG